MLKMPFHNLEQSQLLTVNNEGSFQTLSRLLRLKDRDKIELTFFLLSAQKIEEVEGNDLHEIPGDHRGNFFEMFFFKILFIIFKFLKNFRCLWIRFKPLCPCQTKLALGSK